MKPLNILIILIGIGLLVWLMQGSLQLVIRNGDASLPPKIETATWNGQVFTMTAPVFESVSSSRNVQMCGNDNGEITIFNSYSVTGNMVLTSRMTGTWSQCSGNYINAIGNLPAGTLKVTCASSVGVGDGGTAVGNCNIKVGTITKVSDLTNTQQMATQSGWATSKVDVFYFNLTEITPIEITLTTQNARNGGATMTTTLEYTPTPVVQTPVQTPSNLSGSIITTPSKTKLNWFQALWQNLINFFKR